METLSLSETKMKLSKLVEKVSTTDAEIVITKNGSPAAVSVCRTDWKEDRQYTV